MDSTARSRPPLVAGPLAVAVAALIAGATGPGLAVTGVLLDQIGFVEGASAQSASTLRGLALLFGPGVGSCFIIAAVIVRRLRDRRPRTVTGARRPGLVDEPERATI